MNYLSSTLAALSASKRAVVQVSGGRDSRAMLELVEDKANSQNNQDPQSWSEVDDMVKELNAKGIATEPVRLDDYTGKKMTFFHDPDGLPLEIHE